MVGWGGEEGEGLREEIFDNDVVDLFAGNMTRCR